MDTRDVLFTVSTPCAEAAEVVCYRDTMEKHIIPNHGEISPELIISTLNSPDTVYVGTSNPDHLAFVNRGAISQNTGSPFVVFVNPLTSPQPLVVSACHRREYKKPRGHRIIWSPPV